MLVTGYMMWVVNLFSFSVRLKTSQLTAHSDAGIADVKVSHPPEWDIPIGRDIRDHFQLTKVTVTR